MRTKRIWFLAILCFIAAGCQKARPYTPRAARPAEAGKKDKEPERAPAPLDESLRWIEPGRPGEGATDVRLEFVHQGTQPEEWAKLRRFWTDPIPGRAAAAIGMPGLGGLVAAGQPVGAVKIKVPLGLDDPLAYIPAANPPTLGKWQLGRRMFFDRDLLTAKGGQSCADCHMPGRGFTDSPKKEVEDSFNTPTLLNVVYSTHLFWDGRASHLEEVVQAALADEREPDRVVPFRHAWSGVVGRLRKNLSYNQQFESVFGTLPTQDTVGLAMATFLRTILAGDSIHDRARHAQAKAGARALANIHYAGVLDESALKDLGRSGQAKAVVAAELLEGYTLFRGKAGCAGCHTPSNGTYSDNGFHNVGAGAGELDRDVARREGRPFRRGRFAIAPLGEKNRYLIGAYKTPTLRALLRTAPYFHNGEAADLESALSRHIDKPGLNAPENLYLDPKLADRDGGHRDFGLTREERRALLLFLRALNGADADPLVRSAPR
jgi:cytochrome c peroxidase